MIVRHQPSSPRRPALSPPRPALRRRAIWQFIAVALFGGGSAHAATPPAFSPGWFAAKQQQAPQAVRPAGSGGNTVSFTPGSALLQQRVQQSITNLDSAAAALAAQMQAQKDAQAAAAQLVSNVPNGLAEGGLKPAAGISADPSLWQNANAPTDTVAGGKHTVEVKQTAKKAILTWDSFNVGRDTTLYFNQSAGNLSSGGNDWIALNRVNDPTANPSQILGTLKAEGTVYLLNRNGVIFGQGAQVNTRSLLASSLSLFSEDLKTSNQMFLANGITDQALINKPLLIDSHPATTGQDIVIEKGASIQGEAEGFVILAAPRVTNSGSIVADDGQVVLAAGNAFANQGELGELALAGLALPGMPSVNPDQSLVNSGLIQARRGSITMFGPNIRQDGVVVASTSISRPGSITINGVEASSRTSPVEFGGGSVTTVLPEKDGATTTSSAAADAVFVPGSVTVRGSNVTLDSGSLIEVPGGKVSLTAVANGATPNEGRVYLDSGASIDVSGLADVELPMSALLVSIPRIGQNELADSPLLRNSFLYTQKDVLLDSTVSGTRADGLDWIGSPILNAAGYVENMPRDISQMLTQGGSITLDGKDVIARSGSRLALDGGYLAYQSGWVTTPNLLGADGRIYNIASADPDVAYVGFAGQFTSTHARWGVSQTYNSPLLGGTRRYQEGFVKGADAGTLTVHAREGLALEGEMSAQATPGTRQTGDGTQPDDGTFVLDMLATSPGANGRGLRIQQTSRTLESLVPGFGRDTAWSDVDVASGQDAGWMVVSADTLGKAGFSTLDLSSASDTGTQGTISGAVEETAGTHLTTGPGGNITISGGRIDIYGSIEAPSGDVTLNVGRVFDASLESGITLHDGALVSARGEWVNDAGLAAEDQQGDRWINGGKVTFNAYQKANLGSGDYADQTGFFNLMAGSIVDVSGGGYVDSLGHVSLDGQVPRGRGGDVSVLTYTADSRDSTSFQLSNTASIEHGYIALGGALRAWGFSGGGTLTLRAAQVQVGGDANEMAQANGLWLSPGFFSGQGFANYNLQSVTDAVVADGTQLTVRGANLLGDLDALRTLASGSDLYTAPAVTGIGYLDEWQRWSQRTSGAPAGLSITAGDYNNWNTATEGRFILPGVTGRVRVGTDATIAVDAGGSIDLTAYGDVAVEGTLVAHGGQIQLESSIPAKGYDGVGRLEVGPSAILDASGTSLLNLHPAAVASTHGLVLPRTGDVLDGGTVSLLTESDAVIVADDGSRIDVSGASDTFDLPTASRRWNGSTSEYTPQAVWSDAGSILVGGSAGLYLGSTLRGQGGAASAEGGSLQIYGTRQNGTQVRQIAKGLLVTQSLVKPLYAQDDGADGGADGLLYFAADTLAGSGITSLTLGNPVAADSGPGFVVPVAFAGDVNLSVGKQVAINADGLASLAAGATSIDTPAGYGVGRGHVQISAPYVYLTGSSSSPTAVAGDGILDINAAAIDMGGMINLQGWSQARFNASDDLRFSLPAALASDSNSQPLPGMLFSTGDLAFSASQVYPESGYHFAINANASGIAGAQGESRETTVTFQSSGGPTTPPLSAGGALLVAADHIEQDGVIRVPSGTLVLGSTDPEGDAKAFGFAAGSLPLASTQSVHLAPGSITSVSLDGVTVPYGTTIDGVDWRYNVYPDVAAADLDAPPQKQIEVNGTSVALDSGATIDLSGGGHLQASEFVPGTGGTRDLLATAPDGATVYAILPGYHGAVAAKDIAMDAAGVAQAAVGKQVYLSGVPGLADGYYTLLPAQYATLPGALRIYQVANAAQAPAGRVAAQADGGYTVTGYYGNALSGAHDARTSTFVVQSAQAWQPYSQYRLSDADTFFNAAASKSGQVAPAIAADAGRLAIAAGQRLDLGATLSATPAEGGRTSQVDIAGEAIQVLGAGETAREGYLGIAADGLTTLGAGSLLLGGTREGDSDGDHVTVTAGSVLLSNDAAHPLAGQEIILVADANGEGVVLDDGSVLQARGDGNPVASQPLVFGADKSTDASGNTIAAIDGSGALLRVSQHGAAGITRHGLDGGTGGLLTIGAGALVEGGNALTLDATGRVRVDDSATLSGKAIDATANRVSFVGAGATTPEDGLAIGASTLAQWRGADSVTLRSRGDIEFLGAQDLSLDGALTLSAGTLVGDGNDVTLGAGTLTFANTLGAAANATGMGGGTLRATADEIDFGNGTATLSGFGAFEGLASRGLAATGSGGVDFGHATVDITAPVFIARSGSDTTLATTGAMRLHEGPGTALSSDDLGGSLTLRAGTIDAGMDMQAMAGALTLDATQGGIQVADGTHLDVGGYTKQFFDTSAYAPGGSLALDATGDITIADGATIRYGGAAEAGDAGSFHAVAGGNLLLGGSYDGHAADGYRGGYLTLGSGGSLDLDTLAGLVAASGSTGLVDITTAQGDLALSAGHALASRQVYLYANGGKVRVDGDIDASGLAGSHIEAWGARGVEINGTLDAHATLAGQRGGDVVLGTGGVASGNYDPTYGYETVDRAGAGYVHIGAAARIDVSGGSADASDGGKVSIRAPLLSDGDVPITIDQGAGITGARDVTIEPYVVWSTKDTTSGAQHFDGIIDPAGWYVDGGGAMVAGTWTDASGTVLDPPADADQLADYLSRYYFTPDEGAANANHVAFYGYANGDAASGPGTVMGFVQNPGFSFGDRFAGIANVDIRPGIELRNPTDGPNGGDIRVVTNWNLGAGTTDENGQIHLAYRYQGQAPVLTVRAAGDLNVDASISDGFYQSNTGAQLNDVAVTDPGTPTDPTDPTDPTGPTDPGTGPSYDDLLAAYQVSQAYLDANNVWNGSINLRAGGTADISKDPNYQPLQAPLQNQSSTYYNNYQQYITDVGNGNTLGWAQTFVRGNNVLKFKPYSITTNAAPQPSGYDTYTDYANAYLAWLQGNFDSSRSTETPTPLLLPTDASYNAWSQNYAIYIADHGQYWNYVSHFVGNIFQGTQLFYAPFAPKADAVRDDSAYQAALAAYKVSQAYLDSNGVWNGTINLRAGGTADISKDPNYQPLQAPLLDQSNTYYNNYQQYITDIGNGNTLGWAQTFVRGNNVLKFKPYSITTLQAPQPGAYDTYTDYANAYLAWLQGNFDSSRSTETPTPILLPIDSNYTDWSQNYAVYITDHGQYWNYVSHFVGNIFQGTQLYYAPFAPIADTSTGPSEPGEPIGAPAANNSPSNMPSLGNPVSFASATLLGGPSTSYRLVGGADLAAADPLATQAAALGQVSFDGHFAVKDTDPLIVTPGSAYNGKTLLFPTTVRTGTGDIDIISAGDIAWLDSAAPATIYSAGEPAEGTTAGTGVTVLRPSQTSASVLVATQPDMLVNGLVNPEHAGDVSLRAGGDILGIQNVVDADGSQTKGTKGDSIAQYWWQWMQVGNAADGSSSSIDFANFRQGVMSNGGNVAVEAGGDIRELSVSLPTTWYKNADGHSVTTLGGGDLSVHAGGDILSGTYFVGRGLADIWADGSIGVSPGMPAQPVVGVNGATTQVSTLVALQDAQVNVAARGQVNLGGVYDPSYYAANQVFPSLLPAGHADSQGYSTSSSVAIESIAGDLVLGSLKGAGATFGADGSLVAVLPATVFAAAFGGDIDIQSNGELYPSANGNLTLLAANDVSIAQLNSASSMGKGFGLIDIAPEDMPSPFAPITADTTWLRSFDDDATLNAEYHDAGLLHADDTDPVRVYALNGDISDGVTALDGFNWLSLVLFPAKQASILAGRDIVNLSLDGQQTRRADITHVAAGRDIYDTAYSVRTALDPMNPRGYRLVPSIVVGGPGSLVVEAGRDIGPLVNQTDIANASTGSLTGIQAIGNLHNPYLPHESADVLVNFGIAPGVDTQAFLAQYLDGTDGLPSLVPDLIAFMQRRLAGERTATGYASDDVLPPLDEADARALFAAQPETVQRLFVEKSLFKILAEVGSDYQDASSPYKGQYARGYRALDALFPSAWGYTANGTGEGGLNGAADTVDTGDLDIRSSTIQTQQGGDVTLVGPGGQALIGSTSAPAVITDANGVVRAGPNTMGLLTLEQGNVNVFTDRSLLLAQSRVFTERGGDITIWSSNGDINAGQGAKTTSEVPPPTFLCDIDAFCIIDARGQVSGAGIGTLQTVEGAEPGNAYLVAPRGTVDAGDAGIRVSGNLVIAAARVANADNIQVKGDAVGIPVTAAVNVGALNAASAAATAASQAAEDVARKQQADARDKMPSEISVRVLRDGDNTSSVAPASGYDNASPVQVLGRNDVDGKLTEAEKNALRRM